MAALNVAVIGADGQLGSDLAAALRREGYAVEELTLARLDIRDGERVRQVLGESAAEVVVNTAAMHQVEKCEADPERAFAVNALGVRHLALAAAAANARLVHVSTDYVFDGAKAAPYLEDDAPLPLNAYGNSKLAGELFVRTLAPRHWVLRVSGLYGAHPCLEKAGGLNFVDLMLKLSREREEVRVVDDEVLTPTSTQEVARQLVNMLRAGAADGLYHATAEGSCSWHAFAAEIFRLAGSSVRLQKAAPGEFPAKVPRPKYSVLENAHLKRQGLNVMRPWQQALAEYLKERHGIG